MRLTVILACAICVTLSAPVRADRVEDIAKVEELLRGSDLEQQIHKVLALGILQAHAPWLDERSVKVLDKDRFADLVPPEYLAPWAARAAQGQVDICLRKLSDEHLRFAVDAFQRPDADLGPNAGKEFGVAAALLMCWGLQAQLVAIDMRKEGGATPGQGIGFFADILERPGVAQFPNPIVKKQVLTELRATQ